MKNVGIGVLDQVGRLWGRMAAMVAEISPVTAGASYVLTPPKRSRQFARVKGRKSESQRIRSNKRKHRRAL